jgi:hypothetical protein
MRHSQDKQRGPAGQCAIFTASGLLIMLLALAATTALAQGVNQEPASGQHRIDGYVVRWNTTTTGFLPREVVRRHDLVPQGRGVLNVVVLEDEDPQKLPESVQAEVTAQVRNLLGQVRRIEMREVEENGRFSYLGTFDVDDGDQLRFELRVQRQGETPLTVAFERRFLID